MHRAPPAVLALALGLLTACGGEPEAAPPAAPSTDGPAATTATLVDPSGTEVGAVEVTFDDDGATVTVQARGLTPGFHGFHLHETGACEPDSASAADPGTTGDFLSAGGHLAADGEDHGAHAGDLPPLLVGDDGTASMTVVSGDLTQADVLDADGSAVMVHAEPDNLGNVPERYAPSGPDTTTRDTGDSGGRVACAVLTAP